MQLPVFSPEVLRACAKTIIAYDKLIKTRSIGRWKDFGSTKSCRMCKAVGLDVATDWFENTAFYCEKCPLSYSDGYSVPYACARTLDDGVDTFSNMEDIANGSDISPTKKFTAQAARERRRWLIKVLNRNAPQWKAVYDKLKKKKVKV